MRAIVHAPSPSIGRCELTFVERQAIDPALAEQQHAGYRRLLAELGVELTELSANRALPDCAFVEDTAVVLGEAALIGSLGAASRRAETAAVKTALAPHCELTEVSPPATLEGGDVLRVGRTLLVGRSPRTNQQGVDALGEFARPRGWQVTPVPVSGCLHLKTACTAVDDETLIVRRPWIDVSALRGFRLLDAPGEEPWSANVLRLGETLCLPAAHRRTAEVLAARGHEIRTVEIGELAKAEAGMTCLCLLF